MDMKFSVTRFEDREILKPGLTGCVVVLGTGRMVIRGVYKQTESGTQDIEMVGSSRWSVVVSTLKTPMGDTM